MICVSADVQPSEFVVQPEWQGKAIKISVSYNANMADIVVNVSEQDTMGKNDNGAQLAAIEKGETESQFVSDKDNSEHSSLSERPICRRKRNRSNLAIDSQEFKARSSTPGSVPEWLKPCEYYRQKYEECPTCWPSYSVLQKSAGQKVIDKIAALNKILEEEELKRRNNPRAFPQTIGSIGTENGLSAAEFQFPSAKRRPIKLQPLEAKTN